MLDVIRDHLTASFFVLLLFNRQNVPGILRCPASSQPRMIVELTSADSPHPPRVLRD
ncbi:hypothetical protein BH23GEM10_BH23GEM10_06850 [soil metagenome]